MIPRVKKEMLCTYALPVFTFLFGNTCLFSNTGYLSKGQELIGFGLKAKIYGKGSANAGQGSKS